MTISEKAAYLKGLMDGLKLNTESDEGKMIAAIVDLLGDLTRKVTDIEDTTIAISDELDEIEEDLDAIEDFIMDEEEDFDDFEMRTTSGTRSTRKASTSATRIPPSTKSNAPFARKSSTLMRRPWKRAASFAPTAVRLWSSLWMTRTRSNS